MQKGRFRRIKVFLILGLFLIAAFSTVAIATSWDLGGNGVEQNEKLGTTSEYDLQIITNDAQRMVITSEGNVGIGVTSPTFALDVKTRYEVESPSFSGTGRKDMSTGGVFIGTSNINYKVQIDNDALLSAITLANSLKSTYNGHILCTTCHSQAQTATIVSPDATDLNSLINLTTELLNNYDGTHDEDAEQPSPTLHTGTGGEHSLASTSAPTNLDECVARLNDFKSKYNGHAADISCHNSGHQVHQETTADAFDVDTFKWSDTGDPPWDAEEITITCSAQALNYGVEVTFATDDCHRLGDNWSFTAKVANPFSAQNSAGTRIFQIGNDAHTTIGLGATFTDSVLEITSQSGWDPDIAFDIGGTDKFTMGVDSDGDKFKIGTTGIDSNTRLTIDSSGSIGIGTTSPDSKLEIEYSSGPQLRLTHTDGSKYTDFQTTTGGNLYINPYNACIGIKTATPDSLLEICGEPTQLKLTYNEGVETGLATNTDGDFTISPSSGYVGINLEDAINTLDVSGRLAIGSYAGSDTAPDNGAIISGNVSIGNNSAGALLQVGGYSGKDGEILVVSDENRKAVLEADDSGNYLHVGSTTNHNFNIVRYNKNMIRLADDSIRFYGNGTAIEHMRIISIGYVGIGVNDPDSLLHVSAGEEGNAVFLLEADTDNNDENDNPLIKFRQDNSQNGINMGFHNIKFGSDKFGIGRRYTDTNYWDTFIIDLSNGYVGIGIKTPNYKLHVNGDFFANTVNTGQGNQELYGTNKDLLSGGAITITGGGNDVLYGLDSDITIAHTDTSDESSVDNSGDTVIQDISIDTYGHITSLTSKDLNLNNKYLRKDINTMQNDGLYIATDQIRARDGGGLKLYDDNNNGIFIEDGGQVGIGMADPNENFTIDGAISLDELSTNPGYTTGYGKIWVKSGDSHLYFKDDSGWVYSLSSWRHSSGSGITSDIYHTGNVGIGTDIKSNSKLSVNQTATGTSNYYGIDTDISASGNSGIVMGIRSGCVSGSGTQYAFWGASAGTGVDVGVFGGGAGSGTNYGLWGDSNGGSKNYGIRGDAEGTSGTKYGVYGYADGNSNTFKYALYGLAKGNSGTKTGVFGDASGSGTNWAGYFNNGNVYINGSLGIGTNPSRDLHVNCYMRIEPTSSPPGSASEGDIYYDIDDHKLKVRTDTGWDDLH